MKSHVTLQEKKKPPQQQLMINKLFTSVLYQSSGKLELLLFTPVTIVCQAWSSRFATILK